MVILLENMRFAKVVMETKLKASDKILLLKSSLSLSLLYAILLQKCFFGSHVGALLVS